MRLRLLPLCLAGAIAAVLPQAGRGRHPRCPSSGKTVRSNADAGVWQVGQDTNLRGCSLRVGRVFTLDTTRLYTDDVYMKNARSMAGSTVAYTASLDSDFFSVVVRDLRSGKLLHAVPATKHGAGIGDSPVCS